MAIKYYFSDTVLLCQDDPNRYSYLTGNSDDSIEDLKLRLEDLKSRSPWHEHMVEKTSKAYDAAITEARKDSCQQENKEYLDNLKMLWWIIRGVEALILVKNTTFVSYLAKGYWEGR